MRSKFSVAVTVGIVMSVCATINIVAYVATLPGKNQSQHAGFDTENWANLSGQVFEENTADLEKSRHMVIPQLRNEGSGDLSHFEFVFSERISDYKDKLKTLERNIQLQAILAMVCCATIVIISIDKNRNTVQLALLEVPISALQLILPVGSLLVWIQFGYLLSNLIETRIALWHLSNALALWGDVSAIPGTIESRVFTLRSALNDGGFLDLWFRAFKPSYVEGFPVAPFNKIGNLVAGCIVLGGIFGANHATGFYIAYRAWSRPFSGIPRGIFLTQVLIITGLFLFTHAVFFLGDANKNFLHAAIFIGSAIFVFGLSRFK